MNDMAAAGRKIGPIVMSVGLLAIAVVVAFDAYRLSSLTLYGGDIGPAPFPWGVAAGLAVLGVMNLIAALRGQAAAGEPMALSPALWVIAGLVAQILLLITANGWLSGLSAVIDFDPEAAAARLPFDPDLSFGFSIATGALFGLTARGFGRKPLWLTIPIGVVISLAIYLIFVKGLALSLPAGPIENLFSTAE